MLRRCPQECREIRWRDLGVEEGIRMAIGVRSFPKVRFWINCVVRPFLSLYSSGVVNCVWNWRD